MHFGPIHANIANSNDGSTRSRAFGMYFFLTHLLGSAISPTLVGWISDITHDLTLSLYLFPIFFGFASIIFGLGWRCIKESNSFDDKDIGIS